MFGVAMQSKTLESVMKAVTNANSLHLRCKNTEVFPSKVVRLIEDVFGPRQDCENHCPVADVDFAHERTLMLKLSKFKQAVLKEKLLLESL